jgi:DedD protein
MSGLLDELDDRQDHEITLGTGALLAIFFGVVLVCAVFFGLGYSLGRRSGEPGGSAAKTHAAIPAASSSANLTVPDSATAVEKPSPSTNSVKTPRPAPKLATTSSPDEAPVTSNVPNAAPAGKGQIMVQLMAAAQLEDAQVLAGALNKRGYHAVVRNEPDRLFHVQVGPFATRAEADAMRRKLQSDGYNAILK